MWNQSWTNDDDLIILNEDSSDSKNEDIILDLESDDEKDIINFDDEGVKEEIIPVEETSKTPWEDDPLPDFDFWWDDDSWNDGNSESVWNPVDDNDSEESEEKTEFSFDQEEDDNSDLAWASSSSSWAWDDSDLNSILDDTINRMNLRLDKIKEEKEEHSKEILDIEDSIKSLEDNKKSIEEKLSHINSESDSIVESIKKLESMKIKDKEDKKEEKTTQK